LITGAASGVGFELAKLLYGKDATVYVIARSASRAEGAIESLKSAVPSSNGRLEPLVLDLADLATIKPAIQGFLEKERRVDVLFMNAGVMRPPAGSKSKNVSSLLYYSNFKSKQPILTCLRTGIRPRNRYTLPWSAADYSTPRGTPSTNCNCGGYEAKWCPSGLGRVVHERVCSQGRRLV